MRIRRKSSPFIAESSQEFIASITLSALTSVVETSCAANIATLACIIAKIVLCSWTLFE
jgi:hypothetical protein